MLIRPLILFLIRLRLAILKRYWQIFGQILLYAYGVECQGKLHIHGFPLIRRHENACISLGSNIVLCSDSRFTDLGVSKPVILRTLRDGARISVGANTGLSGTAICAAISVEIGAQCLIGADVQIFDTDFHKISPVDRCLDTKPENVSAAPVIIGDNVFIGAGCKIMKGVKIGKNSVIGAGSIVTKSIPENSIAVGNPAKVVSAIF